MSGHRRHRADLSATYTTWLGMRERCSNKNHIRYDRYGGRGIRVCARWDSFDLFLKDMGPRPSRQHTIDRINTDGNYEPENCRWATDTEQARNRSDSVFLTLNSERLNVHVWAERIGISASVLKRRIREGWTDEQTLTTPMSEAGRKAWATRRARYGASGVRS